MSYRARVIALVATLLASNAAMAAGLSVVFSKDEIAAIQRYYSQSHADAGKGPQAKQKSKGLPPGIARNLDRGKALPPGIAKQHLPDTLTRQLPPVREGYERVVVDDRVLLVEIATQVICDVLVAAILH